MNEWTATQVREIVREQFAGERRYYDDKIKALQDALEASERNVDKALAVYPTVKDFNDLKSKVETEFASRDGKMKMILTLLSMSTFGLGLWVAYLTFYVKPV